VCLCVVGKRSMFIHMPNVLEEPKGATHGLLVFNTETSNVLEGKAHSGPFPQPVSLVRCRHRAHLLRCPHAELLLHTLWKSPHSLSLDVRICFWRPSEYGRPRYTAPSIRVVSVNNHRPFWQSFKLRAPLSNNVFCIQCLAMAIQCISHCHGQ
jgi:hypothetical protein